MLTRIAARNLALIATTFSSLGPASYLLNRQAYLDRSEDAKRITDVTLINLVGAGEAVFVTYEVQSATGNTLPQSEITGVTGGRTRLLRSKSISVGRSARDTREALSMPGCRVPVVNRNSFGSQLVFIDALPHRSHSIAVRF